MIDEQTIELLTPLIVAVVGLILQYLKSKDTDKHGDAFIEMLKGASDSFNKVGAVLPSAKPAADQFASIVAEADKVWNSGGFTADDIRFIRMQYSLIKSQIDAAIARYRELKVAATTPLPPTTVTPQ